MQSIDRWHSAGALSTELSKRMELSPKLALGYTQFVYLIIQLALELMQFVYLIVQVATARQHFRNQSRIGRRSYAQVFIHVMLETSNVMVPMIALHEQACRNGIFDFHRHARSPTGIFLHVSKEISQPWGMPRLVPLSEFWPLNQGLPHKSL